MVEDKFLPEMHLKQYSFIYSAGGPFTKNSERIGKFMQTENADNIYKNDLDKACFQHYMAYGKYRFEKKNRIRQNFKRQSFRNCNQCKIWWLSKRISLMMYKSFDKKSTGRGIKNEIKKNQQLANQLHKSTVRMFKKKEKSIIYWKTIFVV